VESIRMMRNHNAARSIPPSEVPSGARREGRARPSLLHKLQTRPAYDKMNHL
jgi:hypothetical protein